MIGTIRRPTFLPNPELGESTFIGRLLRQEAIGGAIVLAAAAVAVLWANSPFADAYESLRHWVPFAAIGLDLEHWAADGALTLFFFIAGLELKRELLVGSLRRPADALVPVVAAIAGVAAPALIFTLTNLRGGDLAGWAIPAATDIAFALAVLAVVGSAGGSRSTPSFTRVIPDEDERRSPAERLEHRLAPLSAGVAVPFFALMSAGVAIDASADFLTDPIVLGVVLGLVVGKPLGVMSGAWLTVHRGSRFSGAGLRALLRRDGGRRGQDSGAPRLAHGRRARVRRTETAQPPAPGWPTCRPSRGSHSPAQRLVL